jgi:hypothetical protein
MNMKVTKPGTKAVNQSLIANLSPSKNDAFCAPGISDSQLNLGFQSGNSKGKDFTLPMLTQSRAHTISFVRFAQNLLQNVRHRHNGSRFGTFPKEVGSRAASCYTLDLEVKYT